MVATFTKGFDKKAPVTGKALLTLLALVDDATE